MRVEIVTTPDAQNDLVNLLLARTAGTRADDAARLADVYLADIEATFVTHKGEPPVVFRVRGRDRGLRWWQYCDGVWIMFTKDDRPSRFLHSAVRTVTIWAAQKELPRF